MNRRYSDTTGVVEMGLAMAFSIAARSSKAGLRKPSTAEPVHVETFPEKLRREQWERHTTNYYRSRGVVLPDDTIFMLALTGIYNVANEEQARLIIRALTLLKTSKFYQGCFIQCSGADKRRYEIKLEFGSVIVNEQEKYLYISKRYFADVVAGTDRDVLKILVGALRKTNRRL